MTSAEAMRRLEERRRELVAEQRAIEEEAAQYGEALTEVRRRGAVRALELAALDRAQDALRRDVDPPSEVI